MKIFLKSWNRKPKTWFGSLQIASRSEENLSENSQNSLTLTFTDVAEHSIAQDQNARKCSTQLTSFICRSRTQCALTTSPKKFLSFSTTTLCQLCWMEQTWQISFLQSPTSTRTPSKPSINSRNIWNFCQTTLKNIWSSFGGKNIINLTVNALICVKYARKSTMKRFWRKVKEFSTLNGSILLQIAKNRK